MGVAVHGLQSTRWETVKLTNIMLAIILVFILAWLSQAAQLFAQVGSLGDMTWLNQAEHLTLTGGMVIVIVILWRSFQGKDSALIESTKVVTAALAASTASATELREIIKESVETKRQLKESIDLLTASIYQLPCTGKR